VIEAVYKGVEWLLTFTRTASAICLVASVIINFANIICRYLFPLIVDFFGTYFNLRLTFLNVSIPWAEEIMLFLMVGCVFTGCCAVAWEGRQIRMDVVVGMLPPKMQQLLNVLSEVVMIATGVAVAVFAWPVIAQLAQFDERSQAANFPLVIPQAMVPIGYSFMALLVAVRLLTPRRSASPRGTDTPQH
jgi:C4-dicarboxylate transporter, DctQ subunit